MTMNLDITAKSKPRRVFMLLSPRALSYARLALKSLLYNSLEVIHLYLITDSISDKETLTAEMAKFAAGKHTWAIYAKEDLCDREAAAFAPYPNIRLFRKGHPCWRKITDPLLLSEGEEEIVVLDPDVYFPNRFSFQSTPEEGLLLMWQRPNCLLPRKIVESAFRTRIALADHVDIGVAQWTRRVDLAWLDWLLKRLDIANHPNAMFIMHIEAIVWAAVAMRVGGGYLPPDRWHCWHRSQLTRSARRIGVPGHQLLRREPFSTMKCFHAGGEAKHWLLKGEERGWLSHGNLLDVQSEVEPFVEWTQGLYDADRKIKTYLEKLVYHRVFPGGSLQ